MGTGIHYQLHGIVGLGKIVYGLGKAVLNPAIPRGITNGTRAVTPGVNFNLHCLTITEKEFLRKGPRADIGLT